MTKIINEYLKNLNFVIESITKEKIILLMNLIKILRKKNKRLFICGNGGSGANSIHLANDFTFSKITKKKLLDVESLNANNAVITCIANDIGYDYIFSKQLELKAKKDDMLLVFSGSGNSKNIINVIKVAMKKKMKVFAILGYDGGKVKKLLKNNCIHIKINDMQIAEDFQIIIGHIIFKSLI
jgi:D-sedoheptulose 7-phosphate isomerase